MGKVESGRGGKWWRITERVEEVEKVGNGGEKLGEGAKSGRSRRGGKCQREWRVVEKVRLG